MLLALQFRALLSDPAADCWGVGHTRRLLAASWVRKMVLPSVRRRAMAPSLVASDRVCAR